MSYETIIVERDNEIGKITFNRPDVLNAYSQTVSREIVRGFKELEAEKSVRVIIFTGAGRAFMAGADINMINNWSALKDSKKIVEASSDPTMLRLEIFEDCPKPIIAAINGFAFGMGCELAMACDFRIAVQSAKLGQPEISIGVIPGGGGTQRLARLIGITKALEMNMTGQPISAEEAYRLGLLNRVVPDYKLWEEVFLFTKHLINLSAEALALCKQAVLKGIQMPLKEGLKLENQLFSQVLLTDDAQEGTSAFLEKRKPRFNAK
ncbi:MAG: enoyl-CoA hydratase [Syntrophales bacterium LBB04]|nr:enoyl-CoA hydratase [Syntrophales bacterium LBB04]